MIYPENADGQDSLDEEKKKREDKLYKEIVEGLELDRISLGMELTYSAKMMIKGVAMNLVLLGKVKLELICKGLLRRKTVMKPEYMTIKGDEAYPPKINKSISYENHYLDQEEVHPLFGSLVPKLQKQINKGLKALGLLPSQQIGRQKLVIVKKLRQKYESLGREVSVEAKREEIRLKRKSRNGKLIRENEKIAA